MQWLIEKLKRMGYEIVEHEKGYRVATKGDKSYKFSDYAGLLSIIKN